jgi:hypothetical protein
MIPSPSVPLEAMERLSHAIGSPTSRQAVKIAARLGMSVAGLVRALYGRADDAGPRFIPAPLPAPSPLGLIPKVWVPTYVPDMDHYRAQLAASRAEKPLVAGDPRRDAIMQRLKIRALLRQSV